jgi:glycine cleavage system H protein
MTFPADLGYTADHEWVRVNGSCARIGVTSHATEALGDIVYVSLPTVGAQVSPGDVCAELESTKAVSAVYSPVTGVVSAINDSIADAPETIGTDPYQDGWLFEIDLEANRPVELMNASEYGRFVAD